MSHVCPLTEQGSNYQKISKPPRYDLSNAAIFMRLIHSRSLSPLRGRSWFSSDVSAEHQQSFSARQPGFTRRKARFDAASAAVGVLLGQFGVRQHNHYIVLTAYVLFSVMQGCVKSEDVF